jgi:hypothetical protein
LKNNRPLRLTTREPGLDASSQTRINLADVHASRSFTTASCARIHTRGGLPDRDGKAAEDLLSGLVQRLSNFTHHLPVARDWPPARPAIYAQSPAISKPAAAVRRNHIKTLRCFPTWGFSVGCGGHVVRHLLLNNSIPTHNPIHNSDGWRGRPWAASIARAIARPRGPVRRIA